MRSVLAPWALLYLLTACGEHDVTRMIGARCDDSDECDQRCLRPGDDFPGGFCTLACDSDGDCPDGATCVAEDDGICLFTCSGDPGCSFLGTGWSCVERAGQPEGTVRVCRGV